MLDSIIRLFVPAIAVLLGAYFLPGASVDSFFHAIIVAILIGLLNTFVKPILQILTIPITLVTMGLFLIILDALMILAAASLIDGFYINGIFWAIVFGFFVSLISSTINSILD